MEIMIIGTQPPCPRCDILGIWVNEIITEKDLDSAVKVTHLAFDDPAAIAFGAKKGLKVGTAKHVAAAAGIEFDKAGLDSWTENRMCEIDNYSRPADLWNEDFDRLLSNCQDAAEGVSYLMTPILVINGVVKHHGSVPSKSKIKEWIEESI